jgi:hypothetical protein
MDLSRLDGALVAGWKFWTVLSDSRLEKRSTVVTYLFFLPVATRGISISVWGNVSMST